eukprot:TRINITY_DN41033_c0_g1_i1.p1 TRINITY_DN41033_c0_g1~~TRINITY_DN41033_c0_g1_i1.p1  ORF type:complete len:1039 (-),score=221.86 TRINITY_DN41033_c0_g1_i1:87-3203(-)
MPHLMAFTASILFLIVSGSSDAYKHDAHVEVEVTPAASKSLLQKATGRIIESSDTSWRTEFQDKMERQEARAEAAEKRLLSVEQELEQLKALVTGRLVPTRLSATQENDDDESREIPARQGTAREDDIEGSARRSAMQEQGNDGDDTEDDVDEDTEDSGNGGDGGRDGGGELGWGGKGDRNKATDKVRKSETNLINIKKYAKKYANKYMKAYAKKTSKELEKYIESQVKKRATEEPQTLKYTKGAEKSLEKNIESHVKKFTHDDLKDDLKTTSKVIKPVVEDAIERHVKKITGDHIRKLEKYTERYVGDHVKNLSSAVNKLKWQMETVVLNQTNDDLLALRRKLQREISSINLQMTTLSVNVRELRNTSLPKTRQSLRKLEERVKKRIRQINGQMRFVQKSISANATWDKIQHPLKQNMLMIARSQNDLKHLVKSSVSWMDDLYSTHLRPMVNHLGSCAKHTHTRNTFVSCMMESSVKSLAEYVLPAASVAAAIPFPNEEESEEKEFDYQDNRFSTVSDCLDCNKQIEDPRDFAPSKCTDKEVSLPGALGGLKIHMCNLPFGMTKGKTIQEEVKSTMLECARARKIFSGDGVLAKIVSAVRGKRVLISTASLFAANTLEKVRRVERGEIDATKSALLSSLRHVVRNTAENCEAASRLTSATLSSFADVVREPLPAAANFALLMDKTEECEVGLKATEILFTNATKEKTELGQIATLKTAAGGVLPTLKTLRVKMSSYVHALRKEMSTNPGAISMTLLDVMSTVEAEQKKADWKNFGKMLQDCAAGNRPYMKTFVNLNFIGGDVLRISMHERDGLKLAWLDFAPEGYAVKSYNYSWDALRLVSKDGGQQIRSCGIFTCLTMKIALTSKYESINSLGDVGFVEVSFSSLEVGGSALGIPSTFKVPLPEIFPGFTLPYPTKLSLPKDKIKGTTKPKVVTTPSIMNSEAKKMLNSLADQQKMSLKVANGDIKTNSDETARCDSELKRLRKEVKRLPRDLKPKLIAAKKAKLIEISQEDNTKDLQLERSPCPAPGGNGSAHPC